MKIKWIDDKDNRIVLPAPIGSDTGPMPRRVIVRFGLWRKEVEASIDGDWPPNTIGLSEAVRPPFDWPESIPYETAVKGRELRIGPVIAFLAFRKKRQMTIESLNEYKDYFANYGSVSGLVYICAADGIRPSDKTMEGYCYDPGAKHNESPWKYGVFPYPDVVYRNIALKEPVYDELIATLGENMFNGYVFDRWEQWRWLSADPRLRGHLPYAEKLESLQNLDRLLSLYGPVELKPANNRKARRFFKVERSGEQYRFDDPAASETCLRTKEETSVFVQRLTTKRDYVVQQAVPSNEGRSVHLNVIMRKNVSGCWECAGLFAGGGTSNGRDALKRAFRMNERELFLKTLEITDLCISACKTVERCGGHYADLGVDLVVDEHLKVWLSDIDPLPDYRRSLVSLKDKQTHLNLVTAPFEYAKRLAGFGAEH